MRDQWLPRSWSSFRSLDCRLRKVPRGDCAETPADSSHLCSPVAGATQARMATALPTQSGAPGRPAALSRLRRHAFHPRRLIRSRPAGGRSCPSAGGGVARARASTPRGRAGVVGAAAGCLQQTVGLRDRVVAGAAPWLAALRPEDPAQRREPARALPGRQCHEAAAAEPRTGLSAGAGGSSLQPPTLHAAHQPAADRRKKAPAGAGAMDVNLKTLPDGNGHCWLKQLRALFRQRPGWRPRSPSSPACRGRW